MAVPVWRNWQTRGTQNPVRGNSGVGSIPSTGTPFSALFNLFCHKFVAKIRRKGKNPGSPMSALPPLRAWGGHNLQLDKRKLTLYIVIMGKKIRSVFLRSGLTKKCPAMMVCPYCHMLFGAYGELRKKPRSSETATSQMARALPLDGGTH